MSYISPIRPFLGMSLAARFARTEVLRLTGQAGAETVNTWYPDGGEAFDVPKAAKARLRVDPANADGSRVFATVQGAVDHAVRLGDTGPGPARIRIEIVPGHYNELVYVPALDLAGRTIALTLIGLDPDPRKTVIAADIDQGVTGAEYARRFGAGFAGAHPRIADMVATIAARDTLTTANASVMRIAGDGVALANLTVQNLYHHTRLAAVAGGDLVSAGAAQLASGNHQAVAVMIDGADRVQMRNVHLLAYQDTLYFRGPRPFCTVRSYYEKCLIEGDVDFIFGPATAFFQNCEIRSLGTRTEHSYVAAPSTNLRTRFGIVFNDCDFTHDDSPNARRGTFNLARQWFESVRATPYGIAPVAGYRCHLGEVSAYEPPLGTISRQTLEAVGKCVVLNSRIGAHINPVAPWADWNGGTYAPDGTYTRGDWSPRFRPFQAGLNDFLQNLQGWPDMQDLDFSDVDPALPFLGEYKTTRVD